MKTLDINIPDGYEIDKEKSTFERIVFKPLKNYYPETWKKCIEKLNDEINTYFWIGSSCTIENISSSSIDIDPENYNLLPSKEIAKKFLILQKLYTCRQAYIGDWKPNWDDGRLKYIISVKDNEIFVDNYYNVNRKFIFPTLEMAQEFLNNFKSDLEFVKDLL